MPTEPAGISPELQMSDGQVEALGRLIAQGISEATRPSLMSVAKGWATILVPILGGILWLFQIQSDVRKATDGIAELGAQIGKVREAQEDLRLDRWTRTQHDEWVRQYHEPLMARITVLERESAR